MVGVQGTSWLTCPSWGKKPDLLPPLSAAESLALCRTPGGDPKVKAFLIKAAHKALGRRRALWPRVYRSPGDTATVGWWPPWPTGIQQAPRGEGLQGCRQVLGWSCLRAALRPESSGSVTLPFPAQEPGLLSPLPQAGRGFRRLRRLDLAQLPCCAD